MMKLSDFKSSAILLVVAVVLFSSCNIQIVSPESEQESIEGANPSNSHNNYTPLSLSQTAASLTPGQPFVLSPQGGEAPFSYKVDDGFLGSVDSAGIFSPPWKSGSSQVTVTDSLGHSQTATVTILPGFVQFQSGASKSLTLYHRIEDSSGNIIFYGTTDSSDLGGGWIGTHGTLDTFIAKISKNGKLVWLKQIGGGAGSSITVDSYSPAPRPPQVDAAGNVYLYGTVQNGDLNGTTIGSKTPYHTYLMKLGSQNGNAEWIYEIGAQSSFIKDFVLYGDSVYFYTEVSAAVPGATAMGNITNGTTSLLIGRLKTDGTMLWMKQQGDCGSFYAWPDSIRFDASNNIYVFGQAGCNMGGLIHGTWGAFVSPFAMKLDSNGNKLAVSQVTGPSGIPLTPYSNWTTYPILTDLNGNFYMLGQMNGGPFSGATTVGAAGSSNFYLIKFTSTLAYGWVTHFGGIGAGSFVYGNATPFMSSDGLSNIYLSMMVINGTFVGASGVTLLGTHGSQDSIIFSVKAVDGTLNWGVQIGGGTSKNALISALPYSGTDLFLQGSTSGTVSANQLGVHGSNDLYFGRMNSSGVILNSVQVGFGASKTITNFGMHGKTADGNYRVFGITDGTFPGVIPSGTSGNKDLFLATLDVNSMPFSFTQKKQFGFGALSSPEVAQRPLLDVTNQDTYFIGTINNIALEGTRYGFDPGNSNLFIMKLDSQYEMQ